ncbi:MAG: hypothetical protein U0M42_03660 [Acutalibacteraceae bacterium]|nr:hypothetical protein [Acutalibacteraceae bacterium]
MKICRICKTENDDRFVYCKNCGTKFEDEVAVKHTSSPDFNTVQSPTGLVPVTMMLPSPEFPDYRTPQTVYVTPAQKAAIEYSLRAQNKNV